LTLTHASRSNGDRMADPALGPPDRLTVPTVVTDRLILRAWRPDDLDPYAHWNADPEMMRYLSPIDRAGTFDMIAYLVGHWLLRGYGMWAVEDRQTGEWMGRAGLYEELGWPGTEMAWSIRRDRWGQGYATEAGSAVMWFGFEVLRLDRIISLTVPDNKASIRVATKLGADMEKTIKMRGRDYLQFAIDRQTWTRRRG